MARNEPGYAMKSPRGRPHDLAARIFDYVEDAIYIVVAAFLVIAGAFVIWNTATTLLNDVSQHSTLAQLVTNLLDNALLLFIVAELLHTVRATIQERTLVVEPFLIVGLIAAVRRLLLTTAQLAANTKQKFSWQQEGIEMMVLLGLILGITIALVLYHRYHGQTPTEE